MPTLSDRLRAAWRGLLDPAAVTLTAAPTPDPQDDPTADDEHPDPDLGLPPELSTKALYEHWHPSGRTLYGWLILTRHSQRVVGFHPYEGGGYGADVSAHDLRRALGEAPTPYEVSTWRGADGGECGVLGHATVRGDDPLPHGERVVVYDGEGGRVQIMAHDAFYLEYTPINPRARAELDALEPDLTRRTLRRAQGADPA